MKLSYEMDWDEMQAELASLPAPAPADEDPSSETADSAAAGDDETAAALAYVERYGLMHVQARTGSAAVFVPKHRGANRAPKCSSRIRAPRRPMARSRERRSHRSTRRTAFARASGDSPSGDPEPASGRRPILIGGAR